MAIVVTGSGYSNSDFNNDATALAGAAPSMALQSGELVVCTVVFTDANPAGNITPGNSGTALSWNLIQDANVGGTCRVASYWARASSSGTAAFTPTWDSGNNLTWALYYARMSGADTTATPIGSSSKNTGATSVSYAITPAGSGSAMFLIAADANGTGPKTITAGTNCTIIQTPPLATNNSQFDSAFIAPTTNPRTDAAAFTLSETHTGSGVSWVGFEVKAATAGGTGPKRMSMLGIG